jgi:NAD(P)-dependent dehydrogenase (short-subunit alcohol dehydrogenase family)
MTKTWLITGSSRGFGRELAKAVLDNGDRLVATARRPEQLDDLGGECGAIRGAGFGGSRRRSADVGCGEQVGRLRRARGTGRDRQPGLVAGTQRPVQRRRVDRAALGVEAEDDDAAALLRACDEVLDRSWRRRRTIAAIDDADPVDQPHAGAVRPLFPFRRARRVLGHRLSVSRGPDGSARARARCGGDQAPGRPL